jgi:hypothetical protein
LQGTYYGDNQDSKGACSFQGYSGNSLPWATGNAGSNTGIFGRQMITVALNSKQWEDSQSCGMCVKFKCSEGLGDQNWKPPSDWTYAIVNNLCPECDFCDLDIARSGDGRWKCEWCAVYRDFLLGWLSRSHIPVGQLTAVGLYAHMLIYIPANTEHRLECCILLCPQDCTTDQASSLH